MSIVAEFACLSCVLICAMMLAVPVMLWQEIKFYRDAAIQQKFEEYSF
jgi:Sec-independent protein secretion pathway component TatC